LTDKHNQLNQTLKTRHLHVIAGGGSFGAGLFVCSGAALASGGPASLLIGFAIIGVAGCEYCSLGQEGADQFL
jgi:yeast amino acid transporter